MKQLLSSSGISATLKRMQSVMLPLSGLLILAIVFSILTPSFLQTSTIYTILRESSVLLVVGIGLTFVILLGSIDLSVGYTLTFAGLVSARVAVSGPWYLAVIAGLLTGVIVGVINGFLFAYLKVPSFLATLGVGLVVSGVSAWYVGGRPIQIFNDPFLAISQGDWIGSLPNISLVAFVAWMIFSAFGAKTRFGRYTYAIGGAEAVSKLAGIPIQRVKFNAMVLCGAFAGIAGVLLTARIGAATPDMGSRVTLDAIAAVVMGGTALTGGVGGVYKTILGVLVITTLGVGLNTLGVMPYFQDIFQGLVVVVAVALTLDRKKITVLK
jgi:ribose transport system permease protein/putative xylitol transport system permease protein